MTSSQPRKISIECPKCRQEYEDWYRPAVLALDGTREPSVEPLGSSVCPGCGFRIKHGMMLVLEEAGVFIVQADGDQP
jgi:hypothetical protein